MELSEATRVLVDGELTVEGRMPWSSNATFLVTACLDNIGVRGVYKPQRGERPLWDFPSGLWKREIAAYVLSEQLGWSVIPPTVEREGPLGIGSVQLFIDADFEQHYFTLHEAGEYHDQLKRMCAFDILANNTDRKGGHCLLDDDGHVWGIDNGLCFATDFKLRTVIWEYAGEPIDDDMLDVLGRVATEPVMELVGLLDDDEILAVSKRAGALVQRAVFPTDPTGRRYPWPLV